MISPSLEEFRQLARRGNLIPVVAEIVGDVETPVGAFQKTGRDGWSFLFESAERNEESGRFSLIGIDPLLIVSQREREVAIREKSGAVTNRRTSDPLGELQEVLGEFRFVPRDDIPHFQGGAVGFAGYDVVRFFEPKVPIHPRDDLELPEMMFMVAGTLMVFDHRFRLMRIIVSADLRQQSAEDAYAGASKQIETLLEKLAAPSGLRPIAAPAAGDDRRHRIQEQHQRLRENGSTGERIHRRGRYFPGCAVATIRDGIFRRPARSLSLSTLWKPVALYVFAQFRR